MARRLALGYFGAAPVVILAALLIEHRLSAWVFAASIGPLPIALAALGCAREDGSVGPLGPPLVALGVWLEAGLIGVMASHTPDASGPWLGGLPLSGALMIYALWLVPFAVTASLYAWSFGRYGLTPEALERIRSARGSS